MKKRMAIATFALVTSAGMLASCGQGTPSPSDPPTSIATSEPTPTPAAIPATAADLVGDWQAPKVEWTVHFKEDGTFVADFRGIENFLVGTYTLLDGVVSLIGDDGNTDKGTVEGQELKFTLGTLTRK